MEWFGIRMVAVMSKMLLLLLATTLFGCGDPGGKPASNTNEGSSVAPPPTEQASTSATPTPKPPPPDEAAELEADFEGTAGIIDKRNKLKAAAVLVDVRTGRHNGFDRIVFEFSGSEMPGYHLEYIDKPVRACGSGNVVPLPGDGWLQVRFEPAVAHTDEGKPTLAFRELAPKLPNLLDVKSTCDFEAQVEWVAGVASPNHFRVIELKAPTRLAVDIKHK